MKHTATLEDASRSFDNTVATLRRHFTQIDRHEPEQIKLANEYYKWTTLKTDLILEEKSFQIPTIALPNTIKPAAFKWLRPEKQSVISRYYRYDKETDTYIISVRKETVPEDALLLV